MNLDLVRKQLEINWRMHEEESHMEVAVEQQVDNEMHAVYKRAKLVESGTPPPQNYTPSSFHLPTDYDPVIDIAVAADDDYTITWMNKLFQLHPSLNIVPRNP